MKPVRIGISGAGGRMGRKLIETVCKIEHPKAVLAAALEYTGHPMLGMDSSLLVGQVGAPNKSVAKEQVFLSDTFDPESVDVFIDFSTPTAAIALSQQCRKHKIPMVVGVTGFSKAEKKELEAAKADIPLLISPNMSSGMLFIFNIMPRVAKLFKNYYDIEILEAHHRHKKDSPSGTALRLGEIIAKELGVPFDDAAVFSRPRKGKARGEKEIGFPTIRAGDIVGEHRVIFTGQGEQIEIIHRGTDRITYAFGAIYVAAQLFKKKPGLYDMEDFIKIPEENS